MTPRLSLLKKLLYGSGDWGVSSYVTLRQIFYAFFLTDVVGLPPRLASLVALAGILWDALNDPLVGRLSDWLSTRLGRRRPFLLAFALPFGLGFALHWWAPPGLSAEVKAALALAALMTSDLLQTLVSVPYHALMPELSADYDERTSLSAYRMAFNLAASITVAAVTPALAAAALHAGGSSAQGYLHAGLLFGGLAALPFLLIGLFIAEPPAPAPRPPARLLPSLRAAWDNRPFRFAAALYLLNWMAVDLLSLMLPYMLVYYVAQGDLLAKVRLAGVALPLETAALGLLLGTAFLAVPAWAALARRWGKPRAYIAAALYWAALQLAIGGLPPGRADLALLFCVLAGLGVSAAHILPEAIFPDVLAWDELRTRRSQAGLYYGLKNFLRKTTSALAAFLALQILAWSGYVSPPAGALRLEQLPASLAAIRLLAGPAGALLLGGAALAAFFYPLTPPRYRRLQRLLQRRQDRAQSAAQEPLGGGE